MSELALGQLKGLTVNSNKITVPSGHTLYAPGHVIQTVSTSTNTDISTTGTSWVAVMSASITPKFSTSKILIIINSSIRSETSGQSVYTTIFRGTTGGLNLGNGNQGFGRGYGNPIFVGKDAISFLDSPLTTSSTTYTYALRGGVAGINASTDDQSATKTITLMEIAA